VTARRRQRKREDELQVGDQVITIGGFIGELTFIDFDANLARIKLTEDLEVKIVPGAIRGKRVDAAMQPEVDAPVDDGDGFNEVR
jgi:preprotein translocase subunit YajC